MPKKLISQLKRKMETLERLRDIEGDLLHDVDSLLGRLQQEVAGQLELPLPDRTPGASAPDRG